jgi:hypothetical protein
MCNIGHSFLFDPKLKCPNCFSPPSYECIPPTLQVLDLMKNGKKVKFPKKKKENLKELHNQQLKISIFQANSNFFFPKVST